MRENAEEKDGREPKDPISEVERLLRSIDRPGNYYAGGRMFAPMPALEAKGAGPLSFPVSREHAGELFSRGRLSPFRKGTETLRDESVRNSREFGPGEISLGGGGWEKTVEELKDAAAEGLGCPRDRLEAEFHKLLVYAPGGFFLSHRDTEKSEGMVGTLVASLPVAGGSRGGEIAVRRGERETSLDMSGSGDPSEIAWAAFYADCPHEVRPVTEGYRIALVFNLLLRNGEGLRAADFDRAEREMTHALSAWSETAGRTEKIIALLDHDYSEAGLSFESLKNADASVDRDKTGREAKLGSIRVLRTSSSAPAARMARRHKNLWRAEHLFRSAKSLLRTRPAYRQCDAAIRGRVFRSLPALVLRKEPLRRRPGRAPACRNPRPV